LCEEGAYSDKEKLAYERYWDVIRKERSALADSRAEGKVEGKVEGRAEEKEQTVLNSFKNNLSIDIISSITDLSNDEVVSILKKHELM
jgi:predicted transposase/invertase (TIGR01784 family)